MATKRKAHTPRIYGKENIRVPTAAIADAKYISKYEQCTSLSLADYQEYIAERVDRYSFKVWCAAVQLARRDMGYAAG